MVKITQLGVISSARFFTAFGAMAGLAAGVLYSFGGAVIDALVSAGLITTDETPGLSAGTALAFLALIGMPVIFAGFGLAAGAAGAILYNLTAKMIGGVEVRLDPSR